ncbi:MAG: repressor LexA [Chloroflexi bacterium]|nr:repressor LexA [Chloroflexota bacterium]|tara:strand:- start:1648 stop:2325 length:678 start_codon:yes stop_codon:yes gene_type:complete
MTILSVRQKKIIDFIEKWFAEYDYAPSVRDIQIGCEISSTSVVQYNLEKLKKIGILKNHSEVSRSLRLTQHNSQLPKYGTNNLNHNITEIFSVPMLGTISAGEPFPLPDEESWSEIYSKEHIELPQSIAGNSSNIYALKVKGKSMIDALISDGDLVIMQHTKIVSNGQMAAVRIIKDNTTTLKNYFQKGNNVRLEPANKDFRPILLESKDVEIIGKVKAVWRMLK